MKEGDFYYRTRKEHKETEEILQEFVDSGLGGVRVARKHYPSKEMLKKFPGVVRRQSGGKYFLLRPEIIAAKQKEMK